MPYAINQHFQNGQLVESVEIPWTEELVRAEAKARRVATIEAGTTFQGKPLAVDQESMAQMTGVVQAAQLLPGYTVKWKMADNSFLTLDAAGIILMAREMRLCIQNAFDAEAAVLAQLEAGQLTMEQIGEAIREAA